MRAFLYFGTEAFYGRSPIPLCEMARRPAAARAAGQTKPKPERRGETVDHLLDDWTSSDEFKTNALATQRSYHKAVQAIL